MKEEIICWDLISKEALEMSVSMYQSKFPTSLIFWWDGIQLDINEGHQWVSCSQVLTKLDLTTALPGGPGGYVEVLACQNRENM